MTSWRTLNAAAIHTDNCTRTTRCAVRLAYLGVTNALTLLRLLPMSTRDKDAEILALRHQITVPERQLGGEKVRFTRVDRAWLDPPLQRLPRDVLRGIRLLVRPETVLRWHRDLIACRHARISWPKRAGRPPTVRPVRQVLRLARENSTWGPAESTANRSCLASSHRLDRLGDPRGCRYRPGTPADQRYLGDVPALPSPGHPRCRPLRRRRR